jgi:hypothetical protein
MPCLGRRGPMEEGGATQVSGYGVVMFAGRRHKETHGDCILAGMAVLD